MCEKNVALKVSETGRSCIHLADAESDEPFRTEPTTDRHRLSVIKDAEDWSSHPDEAADTKSRSSGGSYLQEITVVDNVVMHDESDRHDGMLDMDSADAEPAVVTTEELRSRHTEHEEMPNSAAAVESTSEKESRVSDTAHIEMEITLASAERTASTNDNCNVPTPRPDVDSSSDMELRSTHIEHEEMQNSAEAVEVTSEKESLVNNAAEIDMDTILASVERTALASGNYNGREPVVFTSGFDVDSASGMDGLFVAVAAAVHSLVSGCQTDVGAATDNSYHEEVEVRIVDSISDINTASSYVDNFINEALQPLTASDQQVHHHVEMDITEQVDMKPLSSHGSFDEPNHSLTVHDSSDLPCVYTTPSKSELLSADEFGSSFPSRGCCEEEGKVCCVYVMKTVHVVSLVIFAAL